jgi:hypothetical protein
MKRLAFFLGVTLVAGMVPALAQNAPAPGGPPPARIRGTISAVNGDTLTIATTAGSTAKVTLAPNATVRVVTKLGLADIKEGAYVGVTSVQNPDGTAVAKEVHVFPAALAAQKPGEGSRPWDLLPQSTMTNATITTSVPGKVANVENRTITLTYPSGSKTIVVPANTPIVTYANADKSALAVGTKVVIIAATPSGDGYTTSSVTAGRGGVDPPM